MRTLIARLPRRMALIWASLFLGLAWCLPTPCQTFDAEGLQFIAGITDDARVVVLAEAMVRPIGGSPEYTGKFTVIDTVTGVPKVVSPALQPESRVVSARVTGRFLWMDCRNGGGELRSEGNRKVWIDPASDAGGIAMLRAIDLKSGEEVEPLRSYSIGGMWTTRFSADGSRMMTLNVRGAAVTVRDVETGRLLCSIEEPGTCRSLSANGRYLAVFSSTLQTRPLRTVRQLRIYDVSTGTALAKWNETHRDSDLTADRSFDHVQFADDDETLISYGSAIDGPNCMIWRWRSGLITSERRFSQDLRDLDQLRRGVAMGRIVEARALSQKWTLLTGPETSLRDRIRQVTRPWLPISWRGVWEVELGSYEVWDVSARKCRLRLPGLLVQTHLSTRAARMIRLDGRRLQIWSLPPSRPWGSALLGSLIVPLVWGVYRWPHRDREVRRLSQLVTPGSARSVDACGTS